MSKGLPLKRKQQEYYIVFGIAIIVVCDFGSMGVDVAVYDARTYVER